MSRTWKLQDAKARFSEVVRLAQTEGPQKVTLHGKEVVTVTASGNVSALMPAAANKQTGWFSKLWMPITDEPIFERRVSAEEVYRPFSFDAD